MVEERRLLRSASVHRNLELHSIVVLALETAMRQAEILGLTWENIDLRSRVAHLPITKNGTKRDVPLSLRAIDAITRLGVRAEGRVFNYTSNGFKSAWRTLVKRCAIEDLHFHDLRHEAVSRLFELGTLDMMEVATISGHKSMQMLKRYTHLKAANLVAKIDGRRTLNRGRRVVTEAVVPYPAFIQQVGKQVTLQFVDFTHLIVEGTDADEVAARARDVLLRELVKAVRESRRPPTPSRPVESDGSCHAIVVNHYSAQKKGLCPLSHAYNETRVPVAGTLMRAVCLSPAIGQRHLDDRVDGELVRLGLEVLFLCRDILRAGRVCDTCGNIE